MPIVSYAQNFEDVMLHRALKHVPSGFFIDVGAHHHEIDSVSLLFSKSGWTGIHVEPISKYAKALRAHRPQDKVLEVAVGSGTGPLVLYEVGGGIGLTTGDREWAERHGRNGHAIREISVERLSLAEILDSHAPQDVHWLKIDVEGMEGDVLKSWAGSPKRPWIVLLESTEPASPEPNHATWEPDIIALGYKFVYFDGLNRFYISLLHPELERFFACGPNVFDDIVVLPGHWIARGMVAADRGKRKKKGLARWLQKLRMSTRPIRHRIKALFLHERQNVSGVGCSPVPGMPAERYESIRDEVARNAPLELGLPRQ
jgi:FkbM family methyltransferase